MNFLRLFLIAAALVAPAKGFEKAALDRIDREIESAIARKKLPGGVVWLERGSESYHKAFGKRSVYPKAEEMTEDTIFDAASLTKVVATAPCVMKLVEEGKIGLDEKVRKFIPELEGDANKPKVTVRHLLTHTSGLAAGVRRGYEWSGYENGICLACAETSFGVAGRAYKYSDINFILLAEIVRRVSGECLETYARRMVFAPLKMKDTQFQPPSGLRSRIAPTTRMEDKSVLRGVVHDPTARAMGGVAGNAGLYTTAADLARFARMMLNGGELEGVRVLKKQTVALMTGVQSPAGITARRGLGWDIDSPYAGPRGEIFPIGSYGHSGWTGTSLWIDPFSKSFLILLSNRNHPTEKGSVLNLRFEVANLAAKAISGFDFATVEGALPEISAAAMRAGRARERARSGKVLNGVDVLVAEKFASLKGKRVGLVTNHSGRSRGGERTPDLLHESKEVKLVALFSPEHGLAGTADGAVKDGVDRKTGLKVQSLYSGAKRKPDAAQFKDLDAVLFDIQDIGCRFYTYISTMGLCMEAAAEAGVKFVVLDRVNPIGGVAVEGPLHAGKRTFTGFHSIAVRHGMTVGELARLFQAELYPEVQLEVVQVQNWKRGMLFDETGLSWINPSPNIRNLEQAILYPGVGLLEFTNLSVGRGTVAPFEIVGAPYIKAEEFARELRAAKLPGLAFVPIEFTPDASVFKDKKCGGVRILLKDREACESVDLGIAMALVLRRLYPEDWQTENLDKLLVHPKSAAAIKAGRSLEEIKRLWTGRDGFMARRKKFLLYR